MTLKIANGHRYTAEQIVAWLKTFCRGDLLDETFQRRIIDVLVNSVYVYDDKVVIYYNVKGGKQVSYIEMCDDMENLEPLDNGANTSYTEDTVGGGVVRISHTLPHQRKLGLKERFSAAFRPGFCVGVSDQTASPEENTRPCGATLFCERGQRLGCGDYPLPQKRAPRPLPASFRKRRWLAGRRFSPHAFAM